MVLCLVLTTSASKRFITALSGSWILQFSVHWWKATEGLSTKTQVYPPYYNQLKSSAMKVEVAEIMVLIFQHPNVWPYSEIYMIEFQRETRCTGFFLLPWNQVEEREGAPVLLLSISCLTPHSQLLRRNRLPTSPPPSHCPYLFPLFLWSGPYLIMKHQSVIMWTSKHNSVIVIVSGSSSLLDRSRPVDCRAS